MCSTSPDRDGYSRLYEETELLEDVVSSFAEAVRGPHSFDDRRVALSRLKLAYGAVESAFAQYEGEKVLQDEVKGELP
jgi:hypothetical protein